MLPTTLSTPPPRPPLLPLPGHGCRSNWTSDIGEEDVSLRHGLLQGYNWPGCPGTCRDVTEVRAERQGWWIPGFLP